MAGTNGASGSGAHDEAAERAGAAGPTASRPSSGDRTRGSAAARTVVAILLLLTWSVGAGAVGSVGRADPLGLPGTGADGRIDVQDQEQPRRQPTFAGVRVTICHDGSPLEVDAHAVPAHLGHGDTVICPPP